MASGDMSKAPPALTMKRACPPLPLFSMNHVEAAFAVMVALAPVLLPKKCPVPPLRVMARVPAELFDRKAMWLSSPLTVTALDEPGGPPSAPICSMPPLTLVAPV